MHDRKLYMLTLLAMFMSAVHHVDHIVRGNHVGWPMTPEVNAFTFSQPVAAPAAGEAAGPEPGAAATETGAEATNG